LPLLGFVGISDPEFSRLTHLPAGDPELVGQLLALDAVFPHQGDQSSSRQAETRDDGRRGLGRDGLYQRKKCEQHGSHLQKELLAFASGEMGSPRWAPNHPVNTRDHLWKEVSGLDASGASHAQQRPVWLSRRFVWPRAGAPGGEKPLQSKPAKENS
jgi:hypothetical protein